MQHTVCLNADHAHGGGDVPVRTVPGLKLAAKDAAQISLREAIGKLVIRNEPVSGSDHRQPLLGEDQLADNHAASDKNGRQDTEPAFDRLAEGIEQQNGGWQADEEVVGSGEGDSAVDQA